MDQGITKKEASERLSKYGKNEIRRKKKISPLKMLVAQFSSPLILILIAAVFISFGMGFLPGAESNSIDAFLILIIVFFSAFSGFFQEYKAEKTIEALQKMSTPKAKVLRDGREEIIPANEIVPGDLVLLEAGDVVPADAELLVSNNLKTDESIITGESVDVVKEVSDKIFMNTFVTTGNGSARVIDTGMETRIGKIADKLQGMEEKKTSFQKELSVLSKKIFWMVIALIVVIASLSFFKYGAYLAMLTSISLAVAAIPEGLPAVVTLSLALGAKNMSKKNALLRKLSTVESAGAVNIICTDKTGTLTMDDMKVRKLFFNGKVFDQKEANKAELLLKCGIFCNNSKIAYDEDGERKYVGDQTEIALRKIAEDNGISINNVEMEEERTEEIPFTSERKMMTVKMKDGLIFSKGAPEVVVKKCNRIYVEGEEKKIDDEYIRKINEQNEEFASNGLRVLGFAYKKNEGKGLEEELIWLGLQAMSDPPRPEVKDAIKDCNSAGIRVIMITGDNSLTAKSVADEIGLKSTGCLEGNELDELDNDEIKTRLDEGLNIFARTSPEHKLRIMEILEEDNEIAMTGDGVNDSLALKKAGVGISMGIKGTEVAKEASDIILLDDNFATIRNAVKEGRRIFLNIRKFVNYLFTCNIAEVLVIFIATLFLSFEEPILLPVQILWINLLTDGMPALALGVDPPVPGIMEKKPRGKEEPIIDKKLMLIILSMGIQITLMLFAVFFFTLNRGVEVARTVLFTGFIIYEFVRVVVIRYQEKLSLFSNKWLLLALAISLAMHISIIYSPLNSVFGIVPIGLFSWGVLMGVAFFGAIFGILSTKMIMKFFDN